MLSLNIPGRNLQVRFYHEREILDFDNNGGPIFKKGGTTKAAVVEPQKGEPPTVLIAATARCHHKDIFSRAIGRREASRRLLKEIEENIAALQGMNPEDETTAEKVERLTSIEELKAIRKEVGLATMGVRGYTK